MEQPNIQRCTSCTLPHLLPSSSPPNTGMQQHCHHTRTQRGTFHILDSRRAWVHRFGVAPCRIRARPGTLPRCLQPRTSRRQCTPCTSGRSRPIPLWKDPCPQDTCARVYRNHLPRQRRRPPHKVCRTRCRRLRTYPRHTQRKRHFPCQRTNLRCIQCKRLHPQRRHALLRTASCYCCHRMHDLLGRSRTHG